MNFFKSKDVHVFPSSFRGKYSERITIEGRSVDVKNPFDPESELNSEANLVAPGAIGNLFENYIVGYDIEERTKKLTRLRCVIGGYYFVIDNIGDYIYEANRFNIKDKFLCIKLRETPILSNNNEIKTKILDSWDTETQHILDSNEEYSNSNFVGLAIFDNITDAAPDAFLKVLDASGNILNESLLPNIKHGTGANSLSLGNSSQGASGNYSIAANECRASGNNSIAVGDHTVADKSDLTVVGKFNGASADGDLFVVGCGNNNDDRQNALKVNANSVLINKPTTINSTENVTGDFSVNTNKFTVDSASGNITVAGDLEVKSDNSIKFKVDSATGNTSVSGTANILGNLTVGADKLTVDSSNGNTSIDGTLSAGATTINGTESVSGDFSVNNSKFTVAADSGNTSVAGTLGVSGKATIDDELEVTGQSNLKDITAVGTLIIKENSAEDNAEKFKVFASGQTVIYNDGDCKTQSPALTVNGGAQINKSLKVNNTIYASKLDICNGDIIINHNSETEKTQLFSKDNVEIGNDVDKGLKKLLLDLTYPIGSVYTYSGEDIKETERIWIGGSDPIGSLVKNNDPKNKNQQTQPKCPIKSTLGGLWVQITGRFLLAAGTTSGTEKTYNINNIGGNKDMMLLNHKHDVGDTTVGIKIKSQELKGSFTTLRGNMGDATIAGDTTGSIKTKVTDSSEEWDTNACTVVNRKKYRLNIDASHKHELEVSSHNHSISNPTTATTAKQKFCTDNPEDKNMPPYLVVYMWKRVG